MKQIANKKSAKNQLNNKIYSDNSKAKAMRNPEGFSEHKSKANAILL